MDNEYKSGIERFLGTRPYNAITRIFPVILVMVAIGEVLFLVHQTSVQFTLNFMWILVVGYFVMRWLFQQIYNV